MIIWINGAFGSGKTQTAHELHRRTANSYVYDPENAGYFIRKNIPKLISKDDFQDYPLWREFNYSMLKHLDREYEGLIIVPMTVVSVPYFNEIVGRLREDGVSVNHFTLFASKETLKKRLSSRFEGSHSWAARQIDRCMEGLSQDTFKHHVDTEKMSVADNAEYIASMANIELLPDPRGTIRKTYDRLATQIKHIRFFRIIIQFLHFS
ncbi:AAA family ATPase [Cohnella silvisoli]|uniref:AAA family ATPase n=1 Tax=Cohnella silvisoli TaxID=2873699 RepID=A0ABV1KPZ0_9BACL|nr:AAA family ATPase [Cohnella silvisoli]MCD9022182.1 AAA family ATPase [Cohnella silvisoli]